MKKLIIAAAIVCAAVVSQAAQFDWSASMLYSPGYKSGWDGDVARVFYTTAGNYDTYLASVTADIAAGNFGSGSMWATDGLYEKTVSGTSINQKAYIDGPAAGTSYRWFAVLLDAATTADAKNYYVMTTTQSFALDTDTPTLVTLGSQTGAANTDNWKAINSVPEPTSGLLLLLGVAGLALRRRRA